MYVPDPKDKYSIVRHRANMHFKKSHMVILLILITYLNQVINQILPVDFLLAVGIRASSMVLQIFFC